MTIIINGREQDVSKVFFYPLSETDPEYSYNLYKGYIEKGIQQVEDRLHKMNEMTVYMPYISDREKYYKDYIGLTKLVKELK